MFQQKSKKKPPPPPRPPPPNMAKFKSKSTYNLAQTTNLIDWSPSPPGTPHQFRGSVSSSYSSSASSLTSSKKSLESDSSIFNLNFAPPPVSLPKNAGSGSEGAAATGAYPKPRIIRPPPPKAKSTAVKSQAALGSPPMPKVPPPSPPKEEYDVITPYGIALYDFPATQSGDLSLQVDDVVVILRRVSKEWLYGKVYDREGIFPENFIRIEVPLQNEAAQSQIVTALYEFKPQVPDDLELKPGQQIRVLRKISEDWLYGTSNGRSGQFPKNFVR